MELVEAQLVQDRVNNAIVGAVKAWGAEPQFRQAQEECAELIVKINHAARGRIDVGDLAEEVADVILCMAQMRYLVGESLVSAKVLEKLARLEGRIAESNR